MSKSNWLIGAVLIVLGIVVLLNNLGATEIPVGELFRTYWPVGLVLWGVNMLASGGRRGGNLLSAGVLLVIGLVLLAGNIGLLDFNLDDFWRFFWPVMLILAGLSLLRGPLVGGKHNIACLGGIDKTKGAWKLESANYWAFMGGIDLDLRHAEIEAKDYLLSCTAVIGGIDIIVPPGLTVICDGTAILGGVEFLGEGSGGIVGASSVRQEGAEPGQAVIKIYGRAFMGGIEVKAKEA
ncbi:MAG: hypothetical protein EA342_01815 [Leptolyngbya sp. LCM1.Bin17]|nr:MAG: hypothetical protein EA342_01815 [Leptolyngbya sp. LCM1.Bin17]